MKPAITMDGTEIRVGEWLYCTLPFSPYVKKVKVDSMKGVKLKDGILVVSSKTLTIRGEEIRDAPMRMYLPLNSLYASKRQAADAHLSMLRLHRRLTNGEIDAFERAIKEGKFDENGLQSDNSEQNTGRLEDSESRN